ncbi:MAG: hypothetical protein QOE88_677, partial [Verrucomicrobiota bacterium]|nr:hypothetical protein [Verrucomicrobiota bacterium]
SFPSEHQRQTAVELPEAVLAFGSRKDLVFVEQPFIDQIIILDPA